MKRLLISLLLAILSSGYVFAGDCDSISQRDRRDLCRQNKEIEKILNTGSITANFSVNCGVLGLSDYQTLCRQNKQILRLARYKARASNPSFDLRDKFRSGEYRELSGDCLGQRGFVQVSQKRITLKWHNNFQVTYECPSANSNRCLAVATNGEDVSLDGRYLSIMGRNDFIVTRHNTIKCHYKM